MLLNNNKNTPYKEFSFFIATSRKKMTMKFILLLMFFPLIVIFLLYSQCMADALERSLTDIVKDFERHIGGVPEGKKYYVVVRSFVDTQDNKPRKISEEIENTLVDLIIDRFRNNKNIVVLERKRIEAIEKEVATEGNPIHYKDGEWEKKLGKKLGAGFLITGTISKMSTSVKIRAEMVDIITGEVIVSSSAKVRTDEIDEELLDDYAAEKKIKQKSLGKEKKTQDQEEDLSSEKNAKNKSVDKESRIQEQDSNYMKKQQQKDPIPSATPVMGLFCCDQTGIRRCQLIQPAAISSQCFCYGQGWGITCP